MIRGVKSSLSTLGIEEAERIPEADLNGWIADYTKDEAFLAGMCMHMVAGNDWPHAREIAKEGMRVHHSGLLLQNEHWIRGEWRRLVPIIDETIARTRELTGDDS